jgi:hypothetical protein
LRFEDSVSGFEENGTNLNDEEEESEDAREDATQRVRKTKQNKRNEMIDWYTVITQHAFTIQKRSFFLCVFFSWYKKSNMYICQTQKIICTPSAPYYLIYYFFCKTKNEFYLFKYFLLIVVIVIRGKFRVQTNRSGATIKPSKLGF